MIINKGILAQVERRDLKEGLLVIPEGVKVIATFAFDYCREVEEVEMPDSVVTIGDCAFLGCGELKRIRLSQNLISIGDYAFCGCRALEELCLPESVVTIGICLFLSCEGLKKLNMASELATKGTIHFKGCYSLKEINIRGNKELKDFPFILDTKFPKVYYCGKTYISVDGIIMTDMYEAEKLPGYKNLAVSCAVCVPGGEKCYVVTFKTGDKEYTAHGVFTTQGLQSAVDSVSRIYRNNLCVSLGPLTERTLYVTFTGDNCPMAEEEIKNEMEKVIECELTSIELVNSTRACRNAYGTVLEEDKFDQIDPDSEEVWFDDYDMEFKVTVMVPKGYTDDEVLDLFDDTGLTVCSEAKYIE